jgi:hypothetical protein
MEIAPLIALCAGLVAVVGGGSLLGLVETKFRAFGLVIASFVVQFAFVLWPPEWLTRTSAFWILLSTQVAVLAFLLLNRRLPGATLMLIGIALNVLVISANQAMPVSETAARAAGTDFLTDERHVEHGLHLRNEILDEDTRLPWLADVIPLPVVGQVASVGDAILGWGIALLVYKRMKSSSIPAPTANSTLSG